MAASQASNERFDQAYQHQQSGDVGLAEAGYRALLADDASHVHSLNNLGVICAGQGRLVEAESYYDAATRLCPQSADF